MNASTFPNDESRQQYLREMGVAVYYPRYPLPGAAASRRYHIDDDAAGTGYTRTAGTEVHEQASDSVPEDGAVPASLDGLKDSLTVKPAAAAPVSQQASPVSDRAAADTQEAGEALTFRFTWFRPDERLCILAGHTAARLPAQSLQMLQRILAALSPRYRETALQGEPFHWPLDAAMPGDVDTARQVVRAFLRRRDGGTRPPFMLILMDEPPVWLFPAEAAEVADRMLEPVAIPGLSQQILRVPALETMAQDAAAKRPAWEAMQSLIQPLAQCDRE